MNDRNDRTNIMEIYGWRKLFDSATLIEARKYFEDDSVAFVRKYGLIHAKVADDDSEYVVDINILNGYVSDMSCTCICDETGISCCHMAAVLLEVERVESKHGFESDDKLPDCMGWKKDSSECSEYDEERLLYTIDEMSETQLKTALYHFGKRSSFLRENLITKYSEKMTPEIAANVKYMIENAEKEYRGSDFHAHTICDEIGYVECIGRILMRYIPKFIDSGLLEDAFEITIDRKSVV